MVRLNLSVRDAEALVSVLNSHTESGSKHDRPTTPSWALDLADAIQEAIDEARAGES